MDIRPCTQRDLGALVSGWPVPGDVHEHHFEQQTAGRTTYLVAWQAAEPVGSGVIQWLGCIGPNARDVFPDAVELNHVQVRTEWRRQGVGAALLRTAEDLVGGAGRRQLALSVAADNRDAARLYLGLGYARTGVVDVCEYDWVTDGGRVQHTVERNELLLKWIDPIP